MKMNQWAAVSACGAGEQWVKCVCPLANVQYDRIPVQPRLCPKVVVFLGVFLEVMEHLDFKIQYNILKYNIFIMKDALHLQRRCEMLIKIPLVKKTIFGKHHEHLFLYCSKIFQQCSWGNSWWQGMSILPANSNPREELISKTRTPSGGLD